MLWWTLQQLKSSNWETRAAAAAQLQASNQQKGVPALIKALDDENAQVRLAVINALAALSHPAAAEPLAAALSGLSQRPKAQRAGSENAEYEAMAVALGGLGGAAVPPLMRLLDSDDKEARRWAAHALGLARDPRAVDPLVKLLSDNRSGTRKAAALALGAIGDLHALDPLIKALANRDPETMRAAAAALGTIGSEKAVEALCALSEDSNEPVQLAVVEALRSIGGLGAAAGLRSVIDAARKNVREAASAALAAIKIAAATAEDRAAVTVLKGDFQAAVREGAAAVGALSAALGSKDAGRRRQAAETLALLRAPGAVEPLLRALRDHDPAVQAAAVKALVSAGTAALDGLTQMLSHHDPTVRRLAAAALGEIGDPRSVGALAGVIEQNRIISNEYLDLLEGIRAAAEALSSILTNNAATIAISDLQRMAGLPDPQLQGAVQSPEGPAVDCEPVRNRARQEIQRRSP
jgi:HEAT repeat protein